MRLHSIRSSAPRVFVKSALAASFVMLSGFAPAQPGDTAQQAASVCNPFFTTAFKTDHIAWAEGKCWATWTRAASACISSSIHTIVLDTADDSIVVYAAEASGDPKPAQNAAQCAARSVTLQVQRELSSSPNTWTTIGSYSANGQWIASGSICSVWTSYKSLAIPTTTSRVRLFAQAKRQDGTYAGTLTLGSYIVPGAHPPCIQ